MWKWVTVLCVGMYVTLMAFGGDGYSPDETANAAPPREQVETVVAEPAVAPAVEPAPTPEVVVEATPEPVLPSPSESSTVTVEVTQTQIEPIAPVANPVVANPVVANSVVADPITITTVPQATITRETTLVNEPTPAPQIWRVTGSRVNLRAAANGQAQIVGRTVRGDSAEIIELLQNGWAKVYIIDSGIEAYMSADFISPNG